MSPYQQQVIDATMTSFDKQAAQNEEEFQTEPHS
jgi:hypothetical protein